MALSQRSVALAKDVELGNSIVVLACQLLLELVNTEYTFSGSAVVITEQSQAPKTADWNNILGDFPEENLI